MITFSKIDEVDEIPNHLGFMEKRIFKIRGIKNHTKKSILLEVLKSEIYFENQKNIRNELKTHHAFTDKIEIDDFEQFTFKEYQNRIEEIKREPDWGEDLPIFVQLINKSNNWIIENRYQNEQIFFINSESTPEEKLIEYNYYSYFMTTIIISILTSKVIIINHGGD